MFIVGKSYRVVYENTECENGQVWTYIKTHDGEMGFFSREGVTKEFYFSRFDKTPIKEAADSKPVKTMIPKTIVAATAEKAALEKKKAKLEAAMHRNKLALDAINVELHKLNTVLGL